MAEDISQDTSFVPSAPVAPVVPPAPPAPEALVDEEPQNEFQRVKERLEEIAQAVDSEEISLDDALDLYEEAVALGLQATDLLDVDITAQEEAQARLLGEESEDADTIIDSDTVHDNQGGIQDEDQLQEIEADSAVQGNVQTN